MAANMASEKLFKNYKNNIYLKNLGEKLNLSQVNSNKVVFDYRFFSYVIYVEIIFAEI